MQAQPFDGGPRDAPLIEVGLDDAGGLDAQPEDRWQPSVEPTPVEGGVTILDVDSPRNDRGSVNTDGPGSPACSSSASTCTPPMVFQPGLGQRPGTAAFDFGVAYQAFPPAQVDQRGDALEVSAGQPIGGNFRGHVDGSQGTVLAWVTPTWSAAELGDAPVFLWSVANIRLGGSVSGGLLVQVGPRTVRTVELPLQASGLPHLVVLRWDSKRPLDGTNHLLVTVNDVTVGVDEPLTAGPPQAFVVGAIAANGHFSSGSLIEGFTVYRRPLFDGEHGVDVGNGDELTVLLGANDHPLDVVAFTGSWDVVSALPMDQSGGRVDPNGQAWTHPHAENLLGAEAFFLSVTDGAAPGWSVLGSPRLRPLGPDQAIFGGGISVSAGTP